MATTVYDVEEVELQDGTGVSVRPLDLKRLRKALAVVDEMNAAIKKANEAEKAGEKVESEDITLDFLIRACKICLEKQLPDLVKDADAFEENLDMPTMWKILETSAGISMGPNLLRGAMDLPGQS